MEHRQAVSICTLKVNINCCTMCQLKAREKLQKINGVESVVCDSKGVMTVSGEVNPMIIVKKLEKWGKNAELLSFQKSSKQDAQATSIDESDHGTEARMEKDCCCRCDAVSDSDSDSVEPKKSNVNITRQQPPDFAMNKQINKQNKGKKGLLGLFRKKGGGAKTKSDGVAMVDEQSKWKFPRTLMAEYGGPRPYHRPFLPYPPPFNQMPPGPAPLYHPFGLMRPPPPPLVPPPYGFFNSRPPPKVNPMIHYTSYADNYSRW